MDRLKMHSPDRAAEHIAQIGALFPNCLTEVKDADGTVRRAIDFDMLRQELSDVVVDGPRERYQFTWPDKRKSILAANAPIAKTLRPCREESVDFDTTQNLYIEGDNLDALKLLMETYLHKIKVIYIDPPYNTGNNLIYRNNFYQSESEYAEGSGEVDEFGNRLVSNPRSNGRFHSDWCSMIYSRLLLARDFLSEDGIIVFTIDDNEIHNATSMMDNVFGEENRLGVVIIKNNPQGRSSVTGFQISHEYALFYGKSQSKIGRLPRSEEQLSRYGDVDKNGPFEWRNFRAQYSSESPKLVYPIFVKKDCSDFRIPDMKWDETKKIYHLLENPLPNEIITLPVDESGRARTWKWSIATVSKCKNDEMGVRKDRSGKPTVYYKGRMKDNGINPYTIWDKPEYSSSTFGANLLSDIIGKGIFSYPKSLYAVIDCLKVANAEADSIILDFFSGSATTAHAVMQLNAEDGGHRKFIMVQLPEPTDEKSEAYQAGYNSICEIGKERIRRSGKKIMDENPMSAKNLDTGFRVLKVDSTNMRDVYYSPAETEQSNLLDLVDNIKPDRTGEDLLFQVMLELGILLSSKIEQINIGGKTVYSVEDGYLLACFDQDVTDDVVKEIAKRRPWYFVMRDSSLADDATAANFEQIFQTYSPTTIRKVL